MWAMVEMERVGGRFVMGASPMSREALAAALRSHGSALHGLCFHLVGLGEAADAAQESFERIVQQIDKFDASRGEFKVWAFAIARNVCRDRLRRRRLERAAFDADGDARAGEAREHAPTTEALALGRISGRELAGALGSLPEPMRAAIVLFHVHEASYEEIAKTLDVPVGTVMTWLHRGRKRLRELLQEHPESSADVRRTTP